MTARAELRRRRTTTDAWPPIGRIPANVEEGRWGLRAVTYISGTTLLTLFLFHELRYSYVYLSESPVARFARARGTLRQSIPPLALSVHLASIATELTREKKGAGNSAGGHQERIQSPSSIGYSSKLTWQDSPFFFFFLCTVFFLFIFFPFMYFLLEPASD